MPRLTSLAVALALFAGACGDSTGPQIELTDTELDLLIEQISDILAEADVPTFQAVGIGANADVQRAQPALPGVFFGASSMPPVSFSLTVGCEVSGSATVSGSGNEDDTSFEFTVTERFDECQTPDFTVDGQFTVTGNGVESETNPSFSVDVDGTLTVTMPDGRTGSCRLDYGLSLSATPTSFNFEVHGTICGRSIEDIINEQAT